MRLYRIALTAFADLTGSGGLVVSGRWHSRGRPIVYAAGSPSLAALEVLAHTDSDLLPPLVLMTIEGPGGISAEAVEPDALPGHWRSVPPPVECQRVGDRWLAESRCCLLYVPSVHVPVEVNALINPAHPEAGQLRIVDSHPFTFDPRLI